MPISSTASGTRCDGRSVDLPLGVTLPQVFSAGWLYLAAMIVAYGVANLFQSVAAARTRQERAFHPTLRLRLAGQGVYLVGLGCQFAAFVLAFFARRELPLFLVQASVAAGLGVTALLGVLMLKWRLPATELALLGARGAGIAALIVAAQPAPLRQRRLRGEIGLGGALRALRVGRGF